ncbi:hypothetical protein EOPP23_19575 [Endozoicomonas sp. OPT23]|nr:hypothetical protein [Endozoicomonas sp. OPT23]
MLLTPVFSLAQGASGEPETKALTQEGEIEALSKDFRLYRATQMVPSRFEDDDEVRYLDAIKVKLNNYVYNKNEIYDLFESALALRKTALIDVFLYSERNFPIADESLGDCFKLMKEIKRSLRFPEKIKKHTAILSRIMSVVDRKVLLQHLIDYADYESYLDLWEAFLDLNKNREIYFSEKQLEQILSYDYFEPTLAVFDKKKRRPLLLMMFAHPSFNEAFQRYMNNVTERQANISKLATRNMMALSFAKFVYEHQTNKDVDFSASSEQQTGVHDRSWDMGANMAKVISGYWEGLDHEEKYSVVKTALKADYSSQVDVWLQATVFGWRSYLHLLTEAARTPSGALAVLNNIPEFMHSKLWEETELLYTLFNYEDEEITKILHAASMQEENKDSFDAYFGKAIAFGPDIRHSFYMIHSGFNIDFKRHRETYNDHLLNIFRSRVFVRFDTWLQLKELWSSFYLNDGFSSSTLETEYQEGYRSSEGIFASLVQYFASSSGDSLSTDRIDLSELMKTLSHGNITADTIALIVLESDRRGEDLPDGLFEFAFNDVITLMNFLHEGSNPDDEYGETYDRENLLDLMRIITANLTRMAKRDFAMSNRPILEVRERSYHDDKYENVGHLVNEFWDVNLYPVELQKILINEFLPFLSIDTYCQIVRKSIESNLEFLSYLNESEESRQQYFVDSQECSE